MKSNKTMKKVMAVVLSLAMVATSITVTNTTANAVETSDYEAWVTTDRNLALNKTVTGGPTWREGEKTQLTDGIYGQWSNYGAITVEGTNTGYFDIDLGQEYSAASIDQIVVWWRTGDANFYPNNGYKIQFSTDTVFTTVAEVNKEDYPAVTNGTSWEDGAQYMIPVELDKTNLSGNVSKVRILVDSPAAYGAQVAEVAVFSETPAGPVELEKCEAPAGITASSDDYNVITYTVEAGEGQVDAGYKYCVYAEDTLIGDRVDAGETYTVSGITAGTYTVKAVSVCNGMNTSEAVETTVEVKDISELITGAKNITSIINNPDVQVVDVSTYCTDEGTHNITTAQTAVDGVIGSGNDSGIRTAWGAAQPETVVIDLGNTYVPSDFESVLLVYNENITCASDTIVSFSADGEEYVEVGSGTGYTYSNTARINQVRLDNIADYTADSVRYIKFTLSGGNNGYGYVINDIGVILNKNVEDAAVVTDKTPVEASVIENKEYTGEVLTADIEENELYIVTTNEGGTDVGSYDVVLTLKDPDNYYWSDDKKAKNVTKTLTFEITKAVNSWEKELAIDSWTYGEEANTPSAAAKIGDVIFSYSTSEDGEYAATVPENAGTYFVKAEVAETANYEGLEAVVKEFTIAKADQNAPEGISVIDTTLDTNADGKITGVTSEMEYRAEGETDYTAIDAEEIPNLPVGTYYVRYKETENYNPSAEAEVVIHSGRKLNITFNQGTGFVLEAVDAESNQAEYGTTYSFKVTVNKGYKKGGQFAVKINGQVITSDSEGVYKIENITEDIKVTVEGIVKDTQEPTTTSRSEVTTAPATKVQAPAKAKIKKITAKKKSAKKLSLKIKKAVGASGYQVAIYKTKKNAKNNENAVVKKIVTKRKVTITSKKLKNKKKLFVKVRAYALNGKTKVYGKWSKVKKVKIK